ncbi:6-hydroxymethylpterin diphosphokinase MptE-like protein [Spirochaeta dissipatitropha]
MIGANGPEILVSGDQVYYGNRPLYSDIAQDGVNRRLNSVPVHANCLYILCSPLLGIGLKELQRIIPESSTLILLELDTDLHHSLHTASCQYSDEYFGPDEIGRLEEFAIHSFSNGIRRVHMINLNGGYRIRHRQYDLIHELLIKLLRAKYQNTATELAIGRLWIKNSISNFPYVYANQQIKRFYRNKLPVPAILLGAGPSAELLYPWIKQLSEYALIIAVDTILPAFSTLDFQPDIVVALESQFANVFDFIKNRPEKTRYILDTSSFPGINRIIPEKNITWVHTAFKDLELLRRLYSDVTRISPAGSVGPAAMQLIEQMLSGPVLCAGIDFAYTYEKTHAKGSAPDISRQLNLQRMHSSPWYKQAIDRNAKLTTARNGEPIFTDLVLRRYQETISVWNPGNKFYTVAGPGLPIGLEEISPLDFYNMIRDEFPVLPHPNSCTTDRLSTLQEKSLSAYPKPETAEACLNAEQDLEGRINVEISILEKAIDTFNRDSRLEQDADYIQFGLPENPGNQHVHIMLRYYLERWQQTAASFRTGPEKDCF